MLQTKMQLTFLSATVGQTAVMPGNGIGEQQSKKAAFLCGQTSPEGGMIYPGHGPLKPALECPGRFSGIMQ